MHLVVKVCTGGLKYIAYYSGEIHNIFVDPMHIGAVPDDETGNQMPTVFCTLFTCRCKWCIYQVLLTQLRLTKSGKRCAKKQLMHTQNAKLLVTKTLQRSTLCNLFDHDSSRGFGPFLVS